MTSTGLTPAILRGWADARCDLHGHALSAVNRPAGVYQIGEVWARSCPHPAISDTLDADTWEAVYVRFHEQSSLYLAAPL